MGRGLISPSIFHYTPIITHVISAISVNFQRPIYPDFIENIYSLNLHHFQASSHHYLQIISTFSFFIKFCWTMTAILSLVPKYSQGGRFEALVFNVRSPFNANSFDFSGLLTIVCNMRSPFEAPRCFSQASTDPSFYRGLTKPASWRSTG